MKSWERRMFGILALGGGTVGFVVASQLAFSQTQVLNWLLCLLAIAIYLWGMWCGLTMLEARPDAVKYNRRYWTVQVPVLLSPLATWTIWGGAHGTAQLQVWPVKLNFSTGYGSGFTFNLLQSGVIAIGVNVLALVLAAWLAKIEMKEKAVVNGQAALPPAPPPVTNEVA